jgi:hypothetical protein
MGGGKPAAFALDGVSCLGGFGEIAGGVRIPSDDLLGNTRVSRYRLESHLYLRSVKEPGYVLRRGTLAELPRQRQDVGVVLVCRERLVLHAKGVPRCHQEGAQLILAAFLPPPAPVREFHWREVWRKSGRERNCPRSQERLSEPPEVVRAVA